MDLYDFDIEFTFSEDENKEIRRKLALLYSTAVGTMPVDREFGINAEFLDLPIPAAKAMYTAEIAEKTAKFVPEVTLSEVIWEYNDKNELKARVVISKNERQN